MYRYFGTTMPCEKEAGGVHFIMHELHLTLTNRCRWVSLRWGANRPLAIKSSWETPYADLHVGCCGEGWLDTSPYPIRCASRVPKI